MVNNKLIVYGAGDNGSLLAYNYKKGKLFQNYSLEGFIDDSKEGNLQGFPILGNKEKLVSLKSRGIDNIIVFLLNDAKKRLEICLELEQLGFNFPNYISKEIPESVNLGKGVYIHDTSVFLGVDQDIGDFTIIGPHSTIEGRTKIGKGNIIAPYSFVGYNVQIGDANFLYPRSTILPNVKVGNGCKVGHHTIQRKDLGSNKNNLRSILL